MGYSLWCKHKCQNKIVLIGAHNIISYRWHGNICDLSWWQPDCTFIDSGKWSKFVNNHVSPGLLSKTRYVLVLVQIHFQIQTWIWKMGWVECHAWFKSPRTSTAHIQVNKGVSVKRKTWIKENSVADIQGRVEIHEKMVVNRTIWQLFCRRHSQTHSGDFPIYTDSNLF